MDGKVGNLFSDLADRLRPTRRQRRFYMNWFRLHLVAILLVVVGLKGKAGYWFVEEGPITCHPSGTNQYWVTSGHRWNVYLINNGDRRDDFWPFSEFVEDPNPYAGSSVVSNDGMKTCVTAMDTSTFRGLLTGYGWTEFLVYLLIPPAVLMAFRFGIIPKLRPS